ncbi:hypothetical protein NDU88_004457 [Pleurodeles waltl]|uniref:Uncharacterized protein n=1 Tax=Pleurodeles waltl TaxID=8319 RepID=A0AAV7TRX5_PLEWA|nr:hypothetical protein NDU88_004457 [Pleurodeles waltl]
MLPHRCDRPKKCFFASLMTRARVRNKQVTRCSVQKSVKRCLNAPDGRTCRAWSPACLGRTLCQSSSAELAEPVTCGPSLD